MKRDLEKRPKHMEGDLEKILKRDMVNITYLFFDTHAETKETKPYQKSPRPKT